MINQFETILYVENQKVSTDFYEKIFQKKADLNVPGMTEFILNDYFKLGLMPISGIKKILNDKTISPEKGTGIPRCELYLVVKDVEKVYFNAVESGAYIISEIEDRDWGDKVCYFSDPDGHIIAFAQKII